jgi:hypothetical protein
MVVAACRAFFWVGVSVVSASASRCLARLAGAFANSVSRLMPVGAPCLDLGLMASERPVATVIVKPIMVS